MIDGLKSWISNIIAVIFFITLIEILLPKGNIKKYIGLVTGVLIIITIMAPVIKVLGGEIKLEIPEIEGIDENITKDMDKQSQKLSVIQSKQVTNVYVEKLQKSIKEQLKGLKDAECTKVICRVYDNTERWGEIKELEVFLMEKAKKEETKGIKSVKINIDMKKPLNNKKPVEVSEAVRNEVIRKINEIYKMDNSRIKIIYLKQK